MKKLTNRFRPYSSYVSGSLFLGLLMLLVSCSSSYTKDNYLTDFEGFMQEVRKEYKDYDQATWEDKDKVLEKYANADYNLFYKKMTAGEQVKIEKWKLEYRGYKNADKLGDGLNGLLRGIGDIFGKGKESVDVEELLEGVTKEVIDPMANGIKDVLDNNNGALDEFKENLANHSDEIKEMLESEDGEWQKFTKELKKDVLEPLLEEIKKEVEEEQNEAETEEEELPTIGKEI